MLPREVQDVTTRVVEVYIQCTHQPNSPKGRGAHKAKMEMPKNHRYLGQNTQIPENKIKSMPRKLSIASETVRS